MPSPTTGTDRSKVLSVRLTSEEFEALTARATEIGVGPSTLARTLVRQALSTTGPAAVTDRATSSGRTKAGPARDSALESRLESLLAAGLETRVAALESWVERH